jgi:hypothetical protein
MRETGAYQRTHEYWTLECSTFATCHHIWQCKRKLVISVLLNKSIRNQPISILGILVCPKCIINSIYIGLWNFSYPKICSIHCICLSLIEFKVGSTSAIENVSRLFRNGDSCFFAYQNPLLDKNQITAGHIYITKFICLKIRVILSVSTGWKNDGGRKCITPLILNLATRYG